MKPFPHHHSVRLAGGPAGSATVSVDGAPVLASASPPESASLATPVRLAPQIEWA